MTGMHHALTPIGLNAIATGGTDSLIFVSQVCSNIAQSGSSFAVAVKSKDENMKQLASAAGVSALMGITEPAIFGVNLRTIKVFIFGSIGGACGALMTSIFHLGATATGVTGIFAILLHLKQPVQYIVSMLVAMGVAFLLTWLFGYKETPAAAQTK